MAGTDAVESMGERKSAGGDTIAKYLSRDCRTHARG
jgi:hypothetical protein